MRTVLPMCLISNDSLAETVLGAFWGLPSVLATLLAPNELRRETSGVTSRDVDRVGVGVTLSSSNVLPPGPPRMAFGGGPTRWLIDPTRPWAACKPLGTRRPGGAGPTGLDEGYEIESLFKCVLRGPGDGRGNERLLCGKWARAGESRTHGGRAAVNGSRGVMGAMGVGAITLGVPG